METILLIVVIAVILYAVMPHPEGSTKNIAPVVWNILWAILGIYLIVWLLRALGVSI